MLSIAPRQICKWKSGPLLGGGCLEVENFGPPRFCRCATKIENKAMHVDTDIETVDYYISLEDEQYIRSQGGGVMDRTRGRAS
jgi:hypothetical protein